MFASLSAGHRRVPRWLILPFFCLFSHIFFFVFIACFMIIPLHHIMLFNFVSLKCHYHSCWERSLFTCVIFLFSAYPFPFSSPRFLLNDFEIIGYFLTEAGRVMRLFAGERLHWAMLISDQMHTGCLLPVGCSSPRTDPEVFNRARKKWLTRGSSSHPHSLPACRAYRHDYTVLSNGASSGASSSSWFPWSICDEWQTNHATDTTSLQFNTKLSFLWRRCRINCEAIELFA